MKKRQVVLFVAALLWLPGLVLLASDPVGVYCLVDKVVLEPNETSPERIQISGTFSLWEPGDDRYSSRNAAICTTHHRR